MASGSEGGIRVETADEALAVLDRVAADPMGPYLMYAGPVDDSSVGDPQRAGVMYSDDDQGGWGFEPSLPPLAHDLDHDYGSVSPQRTRVSADGQAHRKGPGGARNRATRG